MIAQQIPALWRALRPAQWTKNLFVLMPLVFSRNLLDRSAFGRVALTMLVYCLVSSSAYLTNDIIDAERDRLHPRKQQRPLAKGELALPWAYTASGLLALTGCLSGGFLLGWTLAAILAGYWLLVLAYSLGLKSLFILDIAIVISGFLLRVKAGAVVIPVPLSRWLLLCTLLLALFLVLGKRRQELGEMRQAAVGHRLVLGRYSVQILNRAIVLTGIATAVCYTLYTFRQDLHPRSLIWTSLFVWTGIARFGQLLLLKGEGGDAAVVLLNDRPILLNTILWFGALLWILYA